MYLLERGVRVTGIDAWSWDAPFVHTKARVQETGNAKLIWEGHRAGVDIGYCHIEKMHNLEALPGTGFTIEPGLYFDAFGVRTEINIAWGLAGPEVTGPRQTAVVPLV